MNPIILKRSVNQIPVLEVVLKELREERIPVVIYYHGWQTSKELVLTQGRKIAQQGIRVILPDAMNHGNENSQFLLFHPIHFGIVSTGTCLSLTRLSSI